MKALIANGRVVQIEVEPFPVHKTFKWVECDKTVGIGDKYNDGKFRAREIAPPTAEHINFINREYLANTDWYVLRKFERGIDIPDEISEGRAKAIAELNL